MLPPPRRPHAGTAAANYGWILDSKSGKVYESYTDEQDLGPPADYHEVRGHLRIGTVRVEDEQLRQKLVGRQRVSVDEDNAIRGCVVKAIEEDIATLRESNDPAARKDALRWKSSWRRSRIRARCRAPA